MHLTAPWWKRCKEPCFVPKIEEAPNEFMDISPGGVSCAARVSPSWFSVSEAVEESFQHTESVWEPQHCWNL